MLLDELDPIVFNSYISVVDTVSDKFVAYNDQIEHLNNKLMIKDVKLQELESKNRELRQLFETEHTEKMQKLNNKMISIVSIQRIFYTFSWIFMG